jgi:hypothetical protein
MRSSVVAALFVVLLGCQRNEDGGVSLGLAPAAPHRCAACNGTGSITQSTEAQLPGAVASCNLEATGFLGLGGDRIATVAVRNDGDVGGAFVFYVVGNYPGGGTVRHAEEAGVFVGPHATVSRQLRFTPHDGMSTVQCGATFPTVVQQRQAICPACNGRGLVN